MQSVIGVDGCRSGWVAVRSIRGFDPEVRVFESVDALWNWADEDTLILIDIPIGLRDSGPLGRICDSSARRLLGAPRASSVFSPPVRPALTASCWKEAAERNATLTGKRISQQAWGIASRIREVDDFLCIDPARQKRFREVHPELLFWALNGRSAIRSPKKRSTGRRERLEVLSGYWPQARAFFNASRESLRGKGVGADDLLDALVTVVAAGACSGRFLTLPIEPVIDSAGLRMEILYPDLGA